MLEVGRIDRSLWRTSRLLDYVNYLMRMVPHGEFGVGSKDNADGTQATGTPEVQRPLPRAQGPCRFAAVVPISPEWRAPVGLSLSKRSGVELGEAIAVTTAIFANVYDMIVNFGTAAEAQAVHAFGRRYNAKGRSRDSHADF
jgi:hypothetical protein